MTDLKVPAHLQPYVNSLGLEKAVAFLLAFGGSYIYLSENPPDRSPVALQVGAAEAALLARTIGTGSIRVPTGKPFLAAVFRSKRYTVNQIARELHVTDVTVRNWFKDPDSKQMDLFGT